MTIYLGRSQAAISAGDTTANWGNLAVYSTLTTNTAFTRDTWLAAHPGGTFAVDNNNRSYNITTGGSDADSTEGVSFRDNFSDMGAGTLIIDRMQQQAPNGMTTVNITMRRPTIITERGDDNIGNLADAAWGSGSTPFTVNWDISDFQYLATGSINSGSPVTGLGAAGASSAAGIVINGNWSNGVFAASTGIIFINLSGCNGSFELAGNTYEQTAVHNNPNALFFQDGSFDGTTRTLGNGTSYTVRSVRSPGWDATIGNILSGTSYADIDDQGDTVHVNTNFDTTGLVIGQGIYYSINQAIENPTFVYSVDDVTDTTRVRDGYTWNPIARDAGTGVESTDLHFTGLPIVSDFSGEDLTMRFIPSIVDRANQFVIAVDGPVNDGGYYVPASNRVVNTGRSPRIFTKAIDFGSSLDANGALVERLTPTLTRQFRAKSYNLLIDRDVTTAVDKVSPLAGTPGESWNYTQESAINGAADQSLNGRSLEDANDFFDGGSIVQSDDLYPAAKAGWLVNNIDHTLPISRAGSALTFPLVTTITSDALAISNVGLNDLILLVDIGDVDVIDVDTFIFEANATVDFTSYNGNPLTFDFRADGLVTDLTLAQNITATFANFGGTFNNTGCGGDLNLTFNADDGDMDNTAVAGLATIAFNGVTGTLDNSELNGGGTVTYTGSDAIFDDNTIGGTVTLNIEDTGTVSNVGGFGNLVVNATGGCNTSAIDITGDYTAVFMATGVIDNSTATGDFDITFNLAGSAQTLTITGDLTLSTANSTIPLLNSTATGALLLTNGTFSDVGIASGSFGAVGAADGVNIILPTPTSVDQTLDINTIWGSFNGTGTVTVSAPDGTDPSFGYVLSNAEGITPGTNISIANDITFNGIGGTAGSNTRFQVYQVADATSLPTANGAQAGMFGTDITTLMLSTEAGTLVTDAHYVYVYSRPGFNHIFGRFQAVAGVQDILLAPAATPGSSLTGLANQVVGGLPSTISVFFGVAATLDGVVLPDRMAFLIKGARAGNFVESVAMTTLLTGLTYQVVSVASADWSSVGTGSSIVDITDVQIGDRFTSTGDIDVATLAALGTVLRIRQEARPEENATNNLFETAKGNANYANIIARLGLTSDQQMIAHTSTTQTSLLNGFYSITTDDIGNQQLVTSLQEQNADAEGLPIGTFETPSNNLLVVSGDGSVSVLSIVISPQAGGISFGDFQAGNTVLQSNLEIAIEAPVTLEDNDTNSAIIVGNVQISGAV